MATIINETSTLTYGAFAYLVDATAGNITLTVPLMDYDYQFYTIVRTDNSTNIVNVVLDSTTLNTLETNFNLAGYENIGIMSLGGTWWPVSGATNNIR